MTDDLTTLLRDAGRGPTVDLDVDDVHTRGRRRVVARRLAAGTGALVLLGVLGIGVAPLLDSPDTPVIEQPSDDGPSEEAATDDRRAPTAAMADLGVTVVDVARSHDGGGGLAARVVTADGVDEEFRTAAGSLPPLGSHVVVGLDRRIWFTDQEPNLLVGGSQDGLGAPVLQAQDGLGWALLGTSEAGLPLITEAVGPTGQFPAGFEPRVLVVDGDSVEGEVAGIPGIDIGPTLGDEQPFAADAIPEHLAVLSSSGESFAARVFPAGSGPVVVAETGGVDSWFVDVAFVGEEVWIVAAHDGGTDLWIASMDGRTVRRVPTPVGRGDDADAFVVDLQAQEGTAGWVVTLSTATSEDDNGVAWAVDVEGARAASVDGQLDPGLEVPSGVYDVLDARGHVHLLPPSEQEASSPAPCATDEDAPVNAGPSGFGGQVWWLCWDAADQLADGAAHPFVATEVFSGGDGSVDEPSLRSLLEAWAAGPDANGIDPAAGLAGGLDPDVATVTGVAIDGTAATVDLTAGPEVGVLGTTTGGATFVQGLVGTVLQHPDLDTVTITLDGSCEDWAALADGESDDPITCPTYDRSHTPWAQGAGDTSSESSVP